MNQRNTSLILILTATAAFLSGCGDKSKPVAPENAKPVLSPEQIPATSAADLLTRDPGTVLAKVSGTEFTLAEATVEIEKRLRAAKQRDPELDDAKTRQQLLARVVDQFVMKRLLLDEADRRGIVIPDDEKAATLERIQAQLASNALQAQPGIKQPDPIETLPDEVLTSMRIQKLMAQVLPKDPDVTDEEIAALIEKNPNAKMPESLAAHHILIKTAPSDTDEEKAEKQARITQLREQLEAGADFSELAKAHSECPSSQRGGDLGIFRRGQMVKPFEDAAFSQEAGKIGDIVETKFGYHIIRVDKRHEAGAVPKELIVKRLKQQKSKAAYDQFLLQLREKADVSFPATEW
ncbi:MAG: peptidylprolyl isomerase [Kiritimatiellae bacterium]|nr:peptidylprolyl isomerase [Kiritimatiellia bacterium]